MLRSFFQWIPTHVNVCGNEIADGLACESSHKYFTHGSALLFNKLLPGSTKISVPLGGRPPWYERNRPGTAFIEKSNRRDETTFARLCSGHTRAQRYVVGLKVYSPCLSCNMTEAAPVYILACIGCHKSQPLSSPATVLHCLKEHGFMDWI
ncbi:transposable element Tc3 transposase [Trichonephila clavipes]|uniref:Transposable element Tc3 transposase n=1 Tax=Trichonephila clavipes TaxID=2585209 RepID=A0A8X6SPI7_TRICX|nr:transposable element Tc3 transposase [Trichonephila clavipes]